MIYSEVSHGHKLLAVWLAAPGGTTSWTFLRRRLWSRLQSERCFFVVFFHLGIVCTTPNIVFFVFKRLHKHNPGQPITKSLLMLKNSQNIPVYRFSKWLSVVVLHELYTLYFILKLSNFLFQRFDSPLDLL